MGTTPTKKISLDELRERLDANPELVLVEALPEPYYRHSHLPGAINIPHDEVDALAPELLRDKEAETVVYCASGPCRNGHSGCAAGGARLHERERLPRGQGGVGRGRPAGGGRVPRAGPVILDDRVGSGRSGAGVRGVRSALSAGGGQVSKPV